MKIMEKEPAESVIFKRIIWKVIEQTFCRIQSEPTGYFTASWEKLTTAKGLSVWRATLDACHHPTVFI